MFNVLTKVFGNRNERILKQMYPVVDQINALEAETKALSDEDLAARTPHFRERLKKGESLDDLLPEAFAVVREASLRVLNMRHFDTQLIGGMILHQGRISEMKTGEGKRSREYQITIFFAGIRGFGDFYLFHLHLPAPSNRDFPERRRKTIP